MLTLFRCTAAVTALVVAPPLAHAEDVADASDVDVLDDASDASVDGADSDLDAAIDANADADVMLDAVGDGSPDDGEGSGAEVELVGISPSFGYADGETEVEIEGRRLQNDVRFTIAEKPLVDMIYTGDTFAVGSVLTDEIAPGVYDLEAWVGDEMVASLDDAFEVLAARELPAPTVLEVFPPVIVIGRAAELAVSGTGFQPGAEVDLSGIRASAVMVDSTSLLRVALDPGFFYEPGPYSITVENPDGQQATLAGALIVRPVPSDDRSGCGAAGGSAWAGLGALLVLWRRRRTR